MRTANTTLPALNPYRPRPEDMSGHAKVAKTGAVLMALILLIAAAPLASKLWG